MVSSKHKGIVFLFVTVHVVLANITISSNPLNDIATVANNVEHVKLKDVLSKGSYRRKAKTKDRSTSSSSGERDADDEDKKEGEGGTSLDMSTAGDSLSSSSDEKNKDKDKNSDQVGWRKWHRKCQPCREAELNWKDKRLRWICGIYQRARRSFKSVCLMRYRNCQDGTMFVKLHDYRCKNDTDNSTQQFGDTWFYDYKAAGIYASDDSKSKSSESKETLSSSKSKEDKWDTVEYLYH